MATPTNLPATATAGQVYTAANVNDLRGAFRVLQVFANVLDTQQTSTTTTFANITDGLITITPQAASNKILIISTNAFLASVNAADGGLRILRDATNIYTEFVAVLLGNSGGNFTSIVLDSPNTTSAINYQLQFARSAGSTGTLYHSIASTAGAFLVAEISA